MKEKICTVTTIKASLQDTIAFVNYHLNIGIDHMFLFFHDPDDKAIDALSGCKQLTCIRCNSQYFSGLNLTDMRLFKLLEINANYALKIAREMKYDWIIHIDSDELIYSEESLKTLLSGVPKNIDFVRFLPFESVPEKMKYNRVFEEMNLFKVLPTRKQKYLAYLLGCKKAFFKGDFFRGHRGGKSATRLTAFDVIGLKCHYPIAIGNKKLCSYIMPSAKLLHFDCGGFEAWKEKWLKRVNHIASVRMRKNRQCQFEYFRKLYKKGGEVKIKKLYGRLYSLSAFRKYILTKIGLLKQIRINKKLFERSHQINHLEPVLK